MLPFRQKTLVKRRITFRDKILDMATLFPMFDSRGKVRTLILVDHEGHEIYQMVWSPRLVKVSLFGSVSVKRNFQGLASVTGDDAYRMTDLWHYDPWWLLERVPFDRHEATPGLKETNCVEELVGAVSLYYQRDLSRVAYYYHNTGGGGLELLGLNADSLPERETRQASDLANYPSTSPGWELRPFWERKSRKRLGARF